MSKSRSLVVPANIGPHVWSSPSGEHRGRFRPTGKVLAMPGQLAEKNMPEAWSSDEPMMAARLFVGLNVGPEPVYSVNDLVPIVRKVREEQGHAPDASFLMQKGIYTSVHDKSVVEENGAQVIVLNTEGASEKQFREEMVALAETIARKLRQESVILEIQKGGLTVRTYGIVP